METFENRGLTRSILFCVSLIYLLVSYEVAAESDTVPDSHIDLSDWSFANDGAVALRENWSVVRGELVPLPNVSNMSCEGVREAATSPIGTADMPDIWGPALTTTIKSGHGVATYCLDIRLPTSDLFYALRLGSVRSSSAVYALYNDLHGGPTVLPLYQSGGPLLGGSERINSPTPPLLTLPYGVQQMALVVQVHNDIHKQGGLIEVPVLDLKQSLQARINRETVLPSALVIVLFTVALTTIVIGMRYEKARGHNIFAFLAFASGVRVLFVSDIVWDYFPAFSLARKYDLEYMSFFMIAPAYYAFIAYLFRGKQILKADYVVYGISAALIAFTLFVTPFLPPGTVTLIREGMQILWVIIVVVVAKTLYSTVFANPKQHQEVLVVIIAAVTILVYESLAALGFIAATLEWSQAMLLFVMLMHTKAFVANTRRVEEERNLFMARLKEANDNLEKRAVSLDLALMRAEESSKSKSDFLATISHELRTPLNAINGFSELMDREIFGPLGSDHYRGYVKDINQSGTHLLSLVDDILDLSRIEAGSDTLHEETVQIDEIATSVLSLFKLQAAQLGVMCHLSLQKPIPPIQADSRKVRQILINLVNNALKFNVRDGEVELGVWADNQGVFVQVADTGIGIKETDIPLVLKRFGQVDSNLNRKYDGVGIGLPLSLALMRQHGGDLTIESQLGVGTTIKLYFPSERIAANS